MAKEVIAVDLGGTHLRVARVKKQKIFEYEKKKTPNSRKALLDLMVDMISRKMTKRTKAIGVASPGPLVNGVIKNTPNLDLRNFNLKGFLKKKFNKPVVVENDANVVAMAEAKYGCKKKNFFILTLGTGIGGGIIINGKLYKGNGNAGELGHITLHDKKDAEYWWKKHRKKGMVKDLLASKKREDKKTLNELVEHLSQTIASLVEVLDPEIVILMGGIRECGDRFLGPIRKKVKKHSIIKKTPPIKWSSLAHPGILGASLLVN